MVSARALAWQMACIESFELNQISPNNVYNLKLASKLASISSLICTKFMYKEVAVLNSITST